MQSRLLFIFLAFMIGAILPVQAGLNSKLSKEINGAVMAAFISFAIGTIGLLIYLILARKFSISPAAISQTPWWIWTGGLLGAVYVSAIIVVVPKLGLALTFGLVIAGQLVIAIILDHFGLMGMIIRQISPGRIIGTILLIVGVVLIRKY